MTRAAHTYSLFLSAKIEQHAAQANCTQPEAWITVISTNARLRPTAWMRRKTAHPPSSALLLPMRATSTVNAVTRLNGKFFRQIKPQTVLPCSGTAPHAAVGAAALRPDPARKVDDWETLSRPTGPVPLDPAA